MNLRNLAVPMMLCLGFLPGLAQALGLGELTLRSHLNEPLDAEIELLSPGKLTTNEILPSLAGDAEFRRARMERFFHLSMLRYEIVRNRAGRLAVRVTTEQPVTEPFLNFLLELNWPTGRILREYTILLDPVPFARSRPKPVARTVSQATEPASPAPTYEPKPAATSSRPRTSVTSSARKSPLPIKKKSSSSFTGDSYGPVRANDTLWKIAKRVRPSGVTMNQTMLAIQRDNPEAFLNNNINLLRRGATLSIPTADEIRSFNNATAIREVKRQEQQWKVERGITTAAPKTAKPAETANLKLVTPTAKTTAESTSAAGGSAAAEMVPATGDVDTQLAVAKESLDKVARDKADAETRATELQAQLETLQRLLTLKDAQLASLQNKLGDDSASTAEADATAVKDLAPSDLVADAATSTMDSMGTAFGDAAQGMGKAETALDDLTSDAADAGAAMVEDTMGTATETLDSVTEPMDAVTDAMDAAAMTPADSMTAPETPAPAPISKPAPVAEQTLIQKLLANPMAVAGAGGAGILALLGGLFVMRRRGKDKEFEADSLLTPGVTAGKSISEKAAAFEPSLASLPEVGGKKDDELDDLLSATEDLVPEEPAPIAEPAGAVPSLDELSQELTADIAGSREEDTLVATDSAPQTTVADLEDELDAELDALSGLADEGDFGMGLGEPEAPSIEIEPEAVAEAALGDSISHEDDFASLDLDSDVAELTEDLDTDLALGGSGLEEVQETFEPSSLGDVSLDEELLAADGDKDLDALAAELDDLTFESPADVAETAAEPDLGEELDLGLEAATDEAMADSASGAGELDLDEDLDFLEVEDEASTKIDLARAYMDMGDLEGAREILDEVVIEGNDAQKSEAQGLLDKL